MSEKVRFQNKKNIEFFLNFRNWKFENFFGERGNYISCAWVIQSEIFGRVSLFWFGFFLFWGLGSCDGEDWMGWTELDFSEKEHGIRMTMLIVMTSQSDILPRAESDKNLKTSQNKRLIGIKNFFELVTNVGDEMCW